MKDEHETKQRLTNETAELRQRIAESEAETGGQRVENATQWNRMWLFSASMFVLLCILVWLDEIVDIPHLLLGTPRTPTNWQEAILETALIIIVGLFAVTNLVYAIKRKQAEETLRRLREDWKNIFQSIGDSVVILNPDQTIADANQATVQAIGKPKDVIIGRHCYEYFHGTDSPPKDCPFLSLLKSERTETAETKVMKAFDGTFLVTVSPVFDAEGRITKVIHVAKDITERKRAEEALKESAGKYRLLAENTLDVIWRMNLDLEFTYVNPAIFGVMGFTPEEWIGSKLPEHCSPKELQKMTSIIAHEMENLETSTGVVFETYLYSKSGEEIACEITGRILCDETGTPIGLQGATRDITERKQAEEALRESEEQLQTLIDAMPDFVCFKDGDGRWLKVNDASIRLFRLEGVDYRGKKDSELAELGSFLRGTFLTCQETDARAWEKGSLSHKEEMIPHPDGTVRVYAVIKVPVFHPCGERKGLVVLGHDITEHKRAEEERARLLAQIQEQAQQVQQIIDTMPEGVLLLDADEQVILANPVAEKDLITLAGAEGGNTLTRLGDRPLAELLTSPPKGMWHEVATDDRKFEVIARPLETGPTSGGWVLVIRDVTREREIQRYSQQQERLAAVGQLAAGIAHDFNNIMATIILYTHISLRIEELSTRDRERLGTINQQAMHATNLIQQILDFSRSAVLKRQPLDLAPLLKEQVKLLARTLPESIEIDLAYGPALSGAEGPDEYTVHADPTRIQQVVMNLAVNARDAMPDGGNLRFGVERIEVRPGESPPLPEMEAGEWVQVTVSDTGMGIPPDTLPHIFDPFFTTKAPGKGSGLGLAQVYGIVKQHEGEIDVQSPSTTLRTGQVGQGTTFTVYLPALPVHPPKPPSQGLSPLAQGRGETILVVEDDAATRQALVDSLELLNYQTLEAANGQEALAILERQTLEVSEDFQSIEIALVLSDVVMPQMGGIALLQTLKQSGLTVPVVLLTGHPLDKELEELRAQGMSGWLFKPPSLEQLAKVVARALEE